MKKISIELNLHAVEANFPNQSICDWQELP